MSRWAPFLVMAILAATLGLSGQARAETSACKGAPPVAGAQLHGPILNVPDANTVCVAQGHSPGSWIAVRLAEPAPDRATLMAAAFGKNAVCVVGSDGRALCVVEGAPLSQLLQQPELQKASLAWR